MAFGTTFASKGFRSLAVGMAFLLALGACANTNDPTLTPAERQLRQESNKFAQTTAEGAVFGALAGLAIGYLAGGARGAAIGAGAGALTGAVAGYEVAQNNYMQAKTEDNYNKAIQEARNNAQQYQADAASAQAVADQALADIAQLKQQYRSQAISVDQYRASLAKYSADVQAIEKLSTSAQSQIDTMTKESARAGAQGGGFAQSAAQMSASKASLDNSAEQVKRALSDTPGA